MRIIIKLASLVIILASLSGQAAAAPDAPPAAPAAAGADAVAAMFDGKEIKISDIDQEIKKKPNLAYVFQMAQKDPTLMQRVRSAALEGMINRRLLLEAANKDSSADSAAVKKDVADLLAKFEEANGGKEQFVQSLKSIGTTLDKFTADITDDMRLKNYIDKIVAGDLKASDEELKASFDAKPEKYALPEQVHARHILIKVADPKNAEEDAAAKKKIDAIYAEVKKPAADFAAMAKSQSQCPSAPNGGDLGTFERGRMVPEFEKAAFEIQPGQVGAPIKTQFGYHIIKVEEHKSAGSPEFDKVKEDVRRDVLALKREQKLKDKLAALRKEKNIEVKLSPGAA